MYKWNFSKLHLENQTNVTDAETRSLSHSLLFGESRVFFVVNIVFALNCP